MQYILEQGVSHGTVFNSCHTFSAAEKNPLTEIQEGELYLCLEHRTVRVIALRWYLGLDFFDRVPDHSTISQLRRRKPSFRKVFRRLFKEVVRQYIEKGLVSGRVIGTDSTHVRANASRASEELVEVVEEAGVYWEKLDA